ncbi:hypothetical protein JD793_002792 [Citrobacter braakii]|nr:hypothetical protein [Citrobacter braakii]
MDIHVLSHLFDEMYTFAIEGTAVTDSAAALAESYLLSGEDIHEAAESLVLRESLKSCGSGFACGLSGGTLLPLSMTADICTSLFIQMRMCASVAIIGGHEVGDPRVRLLCWGAMAGDSGMDALNRIILRLLSKSLSLPDAQQALLSVLSGELLQKGGAVFLREGLLVPLLGGVLNGSAAWLVTRLTGKLAIRLFLQEDNSLFLA